VIIDSYRAMRIRKGYSAIVFELSNGTKIEVDLLESASGNLLLRAHEGAVKVAAKSGTMEVTASA